MASSDLVNVWKTRRVLVVALVALAASATASAASSVPLPSDTAIVPPAKDVVPEIAAFSGKWVGVWDGTLEHVLVVEQINPPDAVAIYAYGEAPAWGRNKANFVRVQGRIEACTLTLTLKRPATVTYRLRGDGTLDATYDQWSGPILRATLKRTEQETDRASERAIIACASVTQPIVSKLPRHFKGQYRFTSPIDFNEYDLATSLEIANQDDHGYITGIYTLALPRWGNRPEAMCFRGDRTPLTGRYDGQKLRLLIKSSINGPGCLDFSPTFERGKDHYFESKFKDSTSSWYYDATD